ncbi:ABC transporter ATP-binding protein [Paenibacillus tyrfis]|uniref:ABC transporter ATP-binding protein n=1 Tax=Paenibacillus tyrfis TaxID=1501230 RepID=UPI002493CD1F|nr:ABC transporter ATP-binding protein [Paenibacillus tyrfis]GLI04333.1 ABC transporter ATP-binding protein [Paenibacillus tyrfis]
MSDYLVEVLDVKKHFKSGANQVVRSVDGISFAIRQGETLGLVGESGSGKSTLGRTIVGLYEATAGQVRFEGKPLAGHTREERRAFDRRAQMIFQDPHASLNPKMKVGDIIAEGIDAYRLARGKARQERIVQLLEKVGLRAEHAQRFPHEFSGGQRQRIGIARALAVEPSFIVADEPISALDVSIQAQVVNLLEDLQREEGLTYLFIAHDLHMVQHISNRIGVMYLGKMMELAASDELFREPLHPYTQALMSAIPVADPSQRGTRERIVLRGDPPSPLQPPGGCPFHTRCPAARELCASELPAWREVKEDHWVACHLVEG